MDSELLRETAMLADAEIARGRERLVAAIRAAHASGLSQRTIAGLVGRSQPEVNRLLRFHGVSPHGTVLRRASREVKAILASAGLSNPRVFGSTARGDDGPDSDIDLLVTAHEPIGLLGLSRVELRLTEALGIKVDLVLDSSIRPNLRETINATAVPL